MRLLPLTLAVFLLGLIAPARAQIIQISAGGMLVPFPGGSSPGVQTPFSFTEIFNEGNAVVPDSTPSEVDYADSSGSTSISFNGQTFTATGANFSTVSGTNGQYGYEFGIDGTDFETVIQLFSQDPSKASAFTLSNFPSTSLADFDPLQSAVVFRDDSGASMVGATTSFTVQVQEVPEPSSLVLAMTAMLAFVWRRRQAPEPGR